MYSDSSLGTKSAFKTFEKEIKAKQHPIENGMDVFDLQRPLEFPGLIDKGKIIFHGEEKQLYGFEQMEDLLVIVNVLPTWMQIEATHFAVSSCPEFPNSTNLGASEASGVWGRSKNLLDIASNDITESLSLREQMVAVRSSELGRLRWSALGYQYNWTARKYPQTADAAGGGEIPQVFPSRLSHLVKEIVESLSIPGITIEPEAAIVNYYLSGNAMGGHVDDAELTYDHPVVSLSIGRPCVFLVGGYSKEDQKPLAVLLRSGDCLLLCGTSRLRMHGVAKVYDCPYGEKRKGSRTVTPLSACSEECKELCSNGCDMQTILDSESNREDSSGEIELYHTDMLGMQCPLRMRHRSRDSSGIDIAGKRKVDTIEICSASEVNTTTNGMCCDYCAQPILDALEIQRVKRYLQMARVNINSRQVYPNSIDERSDVLHTMHHQVNGKDDRAGISNVSK